MSESVRRYAALSIEQQIRVLAAFGHNLTVAARDTYEVGAEGVRDPQRLRDINEIQHRVLSHIGSLATRCVRRYSDDSLLAHVFECGDERLRVQTRRAFDQALQVVD